MGDPITLRDDPHQHTPIERYDHTGDRLTKSTAAHGTEFYQYQLGTHRLLATVGPDLTARAMDSNGDTSAIASLGGLAGFGYDDRNRRALVQQNFHTVIRYLLNGRGERVRKELAGKQAVGRDFIYNERGRLLAEYTDRNGGSKDYVWADDTLVAIYTACRQGACRLQDDVAVGGIRRVCSVAGAGGCGTHINAR